MSHPTAPTPRRRALVLLLAVGLVLGGLAGLLLGPRSPSPGAAVAGDAALAADFRSTLADDHGLGAVSLARFRSGQVTYAGLAPEGTPLPSPQTRFELGSVTKTMTGLLLADAVTRGEMTLDAPLQTYLPELAGTAAGAATPVQLATHSSGLPPLPAGRTLRGLLAGWGATNPYDVSTAELLRLTRDTPVRPPGRYAYSNLGMALLGHAEARAAGATDWPALAQQRLLGPLGMTATTFVTRADPQPPVAGTAAPHRANGWPTASWWGEGFAPVGSSTRTTAEDLMRYARAVLAGTAPGLAALQPRSDASDGRIGLAWFTSRVLDQELLWHNGATGGSRSMFILDRASGQAVVVLNASDRWIDRPGLQLGAARPGATLQAADRPAAGYPLIAAAAAGLVLLVSGLRTLVAAAPHRAAQLGGLLSALAGLVLLRVRGPWVFVPAELWSALVGLTLAGVALGIARARTLPGLPERRRAGAVTSVVVSAAVLALAIWSA